MDNPLQSARTVVTPRPRWRSFRRRLGSVLVLAGLVMLVWSLVVWQWNDPFTSLYTRWQQGRLADEYETLVRTERARYVPATKTTSPEEAARLIERAAGDFRQRATEGSAVGRITIPRLGVRMVIVDGTSSGTLRKGPGLHRATFMPGEGELVYIAGHRTTYRAPFAHIDRLSTGDRVSIAMPYATIEYAVSGHSIVDDEDLSVLRSHGREVLALQACHPRFFASQRYIVWARPARITTPDGTTFRPRRT